jgi:DNA-binding MarR family transcriptional regulator
MEKNSLVRRVKDMNDRRVVRIHLLEKGTESIEKAIDKRRDYLRGIFTNFTKEQIDSLQKSLGFLHKEMR